LVRTNPKPRLVTAKEKTGPTSDIPLPHTLCVATTTTTTTNISFSFSQPTCRLIGAGRPSQLGGPRNISTNWLAAHPATFRRKLIGPVFN
jgi:hypothetical protein